MNLRGLPLQVQALLLTQCLFAFGFYLVVPFIAVQMTSELGAGGAVVGLVLGIRTFSQQGFFFLGGGLTDRFGVRPVLLVGIALRVAGFVVAGLATEIATMTAGVVLIGFAAALFSPAVETALAVEGERLEREGSTKRSRVFALDTAWSKIGTLLGPVAGALLIPVGFTTVSFAGAVVFSLIFVLHVVILRGIDFHSSESRVLPDGGDHPARRSVAASAMVAAWTRVLRNRTFIAFAIGYSTYLVAYNMQYLALPVELRRATGSDSLLGWFFALASIYVILLQGRCNASAADWRPSVALRSGFALMSAAFLLVALFAPFTLPGVWALLPSTVFILVLHLGMMISVPIARDQVGKIAGETDLGSYYGFLNSFGGLAVLIGSVAVGRLLDLAEEPSPAAMVPWLLMTVVLAVSAVSLGNRARGHGVNSPGSPDQGRSAAQSTAPSTTP